MVTISHLVKKLVNDRPLLIEALSQEIINYANLAEKIKPIIEKELEKKVKTSAIVMALRRYSEELSKKAVHFKKFNFESEIIMKTNLCDITIIKSSTSMDKIKKFYHIVDFEKGDTLNITQGNYEITIVISQKYLNKVKEILKGEKILNIQKNLVSLTLSYSKDFLYTPGILSTITRKLAWDNINIYENISTMTELIFIISAKDATKAYNSLQSLIEEKD